VPNPFFHFKKFSVYTHSNGLKVTTDACLLGAFADIQPIPHNILDIGTGSGVIALMLAQRFEDSQITAIELIEEIYLQAEENFKKSIFSNRIKNVHGDFLKHHFQNQFELIVCNPPYFSHRNDESLNEIKYKEKSIAMHNQSMNLTDLCKNVQTNLSKEGQFWAIMPPIEMHDLKTEAAKQGLHVTKEINIYNKGNRLHRQIIAFGFENKTASNIQFTIQDKKGYTDEFRRLMHDFYLENTENYKR
jgi:tRNA1Val (adenine37-N6)-methyltransferase